MGTAEFANVAAIILHKVMLATLVSMLLLGEVFADNLDKFYVAGDVGAVSYVNMSKFPSPRSFQITVGKRFAPDFAGEVSFVKFGDSKSISPSSGGTDKLAASALQFAAIGSLPLDEKIELLGKIGLSLNRASGSNSDGASADKSNTAVLFGVGQVYHFTPQVAVRLQYEDFGAFESASSPMKATVFSLGIVYDL